MIEGVGSALSTEHVRAMSTGVEFQHKLSWQDPFHYNYYYQYLIQAQHVCVLNQN